MKHSTDTESVVGEDRRPLASRNTGWARLIARRAVALGLSPNAISIASMGFAGVALAALVLSAGSTVGAAALWLLLAALACQLRLLCNLIDGMVAIEGGRASSTGAVWNELPDRVADVLILVGCGVAADAQTLGWAAAVLAVMTAYVRELGHRLTGFVDFGGVMAKPQRMATVTLACLLGAGAHWFGVSTVTAIFRVALVLVVLGALWVTLTRTRHLLSALRESSS